MKWTNMEKMIGLVEDNVTSKIHTHIENMGHSIFSPTRNIIGNPADVFNISMAQCRLDV
jgi:hypothetical protein